MAPPEKPEPGNPTGLAASGAAGTGALDFTKEPAPAPLRDPIQRSYDPTQDREKLRGQIAISVLALLGSMVVGPFVLIGFHVLSLSEVKELLTITYGPIITLAGTAMGFYFGASKSRQD